MVIWPTCTRTTEDLSPDRAERAEAVRVRRVTLGWSQCQPAERAGRNCPGVVRFEVGFDATLQLLERLVAALGLTVAVISP